MERVALNRTSKSNNIVPCEGPRFMSEVQNLLTWMGIANKPSTAVQPRINGQAKRCNRVLVEVDPAQNDGADMLPKR